MSLHAHTPQLQVIDPRALLVREVEYCRNVENGDAEQRVTRHAWDEAGRAVADWDSRLWANGLSANTSVIRSLSGQVLLNESVDAGWRVSLSGADGQRMDIWDGRGSSSLTEYDDLLRKVCVTESPAEQPRRVVERLTYGDASDTSALHNLCGQLMRHDDPAGALFIADYGLGGAVLVENQRFLNDAQTVDWPLDVAQRDSLLEPGNGYSTLQTRDAAFVSISQTDAAGNRSTHAYGLDGLLNETRFTLADSPNTPSLISDIRYNAEGQVLSERLGNGVVTENSYEFGTSRLIRVNASEHRLEKNKRGKESLNIYISVEPSNVAAHTDSEAAMSPKNKTDIALAASTSVRASSPTPSTSTPAKRRRLSANLKLTPADPAHWPPTGQPTPRSAA